MITDRGWMYVGQEDWPTHGLLLQMGPRVAILGYLDDPGLPPGRPPFEEHLDLCQSTIDHLNAAAWDDPAVTRQRTASCGRRCERVPFGAIKLARGVR
jgi:hypothetical protein